MRLVQLTGVYLHGQHNTAAQLQPVTILRGPNEAGKSTLLGLAELAINGNSGKNWPVLGVSPSYKWSVSAIFDDGTSITRGMDRRGKHWATFNGRPENLSVVQSQIRDSIGEAATWSVSEFVNLTPAKRLEFLESKVLTGIGWTAERLEAELADVHKYLVELEAYENAPPMEKARECLPHLIRHVHDCWREYNSTAKDLAKAVKRDEKEAEAEQRPPGTVASWEARRAELDEEISRLRVEVGKDEAAAPERTRLLQDIQAAQEQLENVKDLSVLEEDLQRATHDEATHEQAATSAKQRMDDLTAAANGLASRKQELAGKADEAAGVYNETASAWSAYQAAQDVVEEVLPLLTRADRMLVDLAAGRDDVDSWTSDLDEWKERYSSSRGHDLKASLEQQRQTWNGLEAQVQAASRQHAAKAVELRQAADAANVAERNLEHYRHKRVAAEARLQAAKENQGEREAEARAGLEQLTDRLTGLGETSSAHAVLLEEAQTERKEVQTALDAANDYQARRADRSVRLREKEEAEDARTACRQTEQALQATLGKMLSEMTAPLEEAVNRIVTVALGCTFRVHVEDGGAYFLLDDVPLDTASTSQRVVTMMALRCAVVQQLGGWRALLVDDLNTLDNDRRTAFLRAMVAEVEGGYLDNFIGALVADEWSAPDGVHTIELGAPDASAP